MGSLDGVVVIRNTQERYLEALVRGSIGRPVPTLNGHVAVIYCNKNGDKNIMNYAFAVEFHCCDKLLKVGRRAGNGRRKKNTNYTLVLFRFNYSCSLGGGSL